MVASLITAARKRLTRKQPCPLVVATPVLDPTAPRKRLTRKQPCPLVVATPAFDPIAAGVWAHALAAEHCAADGLVALPLDARRTHVHYTHCRTANPSDVQPSQLTWE